MPRVTLLAVLFGSLLLLSSDGLVGQEAKKDDPKAKKADEPVGKFKGFLPPNYKKLGLSEAQVQEIYKIQSKYNTEIDKYEAKIKELKGTRDKEVKGVLTPEQKKRLDDILTGKDK